MMKRVADRFAETLATAGVTRIYGIVGDSLNGLTLKSVMRTKGEDVLDLARTNLWR
jgi:hypothetical protein